MSTVDIKVHIIAVMSNRFYFDFVFFFIKLKMSLHISPYINGCKRKKETFKLCYASCTRILHLELFKGIPKCNCLRYVVCRFHMTTQQKYTISYDSAFFS